MGRSHRTAPFLELKEHSGFVLGVAFNRRWHAPCHHSPDRTVRLWDAHTGDRLLDLSVPTGPADFLAFSPDSTRLTGWEIRRTAFIWDLATGRPCLGPSPSSAGGGLGLVPRTAGMGGVLDGEIRPACWTFSVNSTRVSWPIASGATRPDPDWHAERANASRARRPVGRGRLRF